MVVSDEYGRPTIKCDSEFTALSLMGLSLEWEDGDSGDYEILCICEGYQIEADDSECRCIISKHFLDWLAKADKDDREFTLVYRHKEFVSGKMLDAILGKIEDSETTED